MSATPTRESVMRTATLPLVAGAFQMNAGQRLPQLLRRVTRNAILRPNDAQEVQMSVCQHCGADAVGVDGVCAVCGWRASARSSMNESDPQATRADDPAATRADGSSHAPGGLRAGGS